MTSPAEMILADARSRGVSVSPNGDKLRVLMPPDMPDYTWQGIRSDLLAHKPDVLRVLDEEARGCRVVDGPSLAWFTDPTCTVAHSEIAASLAHEAAMLAARVKPGGGARKQPTPTFNR